MGEISKKAQERRVWWYGHVMRKDEEYMGETVMRMDVEERRRKGRPKQRWMDSVNVDSRENGLSGEETHNRAVWRQLVTHIDPTKKWGNLQRKRRSSLLFLQSSLIGF